MDTLLAQQSERVEPLSQPQPSERAELFPQPQPKPPERAELFPQPQLHERTKLFS